MAKVLGIGLSGQMHGMVALDANDSVLRPQFCGMTHATPPRQTDLIPGFLHFEKSEETR